MPLNLWQRASQNTHETAPPPIQSPPYGKDSNGPMGQTTSFPSWMTGTFPWVYRIHVHTAERVSKGTFCMSLYLGDSHLAFNFSSSFSLAAALRSSLACFEKVDGLLSGAASFRISTISAFNFLIVLVDPSACHAPSASASAPSRRFLVEP